MVRKRVSPLFILTPKFLQIMKDYGGRYRGEGEIDPNFRVFYEEEPPKLVKNVRDGKE